MPSPSLKIRTFDEEPIAVGIDDYRYPERVKAIVDMMRTKPIARLHMIGNTELLRMPSIGICGSRKPSEHGLDIARDCARQATEEDIVVVSGNAAGVDLEAHFHSLANGGSTILVLPEGFRYFRTRKDLQDVWDWERVLVISQFDWDARWQAYRAMDRNNLIIALSHAVIVVEASEKGGTLDTGTKMLNMKRDSALFVAQYQNMPESALGNQTLINRGAQELTKSKETGRADLTKVFEQARRDDLYKNIHEQVELFDKHV